MCVCACVCARICLSHRCHYRLCRLFFCSPARLDQIKFNQEDSWCWMVQSWSLTAFILQIRAYEAMNGYYKSLLYSQPPQFLPACWAKSVTAYWFSAQSFLLLGWLVLKFFLYNFPQFLKIIFYKQCIITSCILKILSNLHNPVAELSGLGHFAALLPLTLTQLLITYVSNKTLRGVLL